MVPLPVSSTTHTVFHPPVLGGERAIMMCMLPSHPDGARDDGGLASDCRSLFGTHTHTSMPELNTMCLGMTACGREHNVPLHTLRCSKRRQVKEVLRIGVLAHCDLARGMFAASARARLGMAQSNTNSTTATGTRRRPMRTVMTVPANSSLASILQHRKPHGTKL